MSKIRIAALAPILAFAALIAAPAQADLVVGCAGQSNCSANIDNSSGNTNPLVVLNQTYGSYEIGSLLIDPQGSCPAGCMLDITNMDVSSSSGGSFTLYVTEDYLTANQVTGFIMAMSATTTGGLTDTRQFYLDTNNGIGAAGLQTLLGTDGSSNPDQTCLSGSCSESATLHYLKSLNSSAFSITEVLTLSSTGVGSLQSGDVITPTIPEPASLALLGAGLVGLSALRRRKNKKAA